MKTPFLYKYEKLIHFSFNNVSLLKVYCQTYYEAAVSTLKEFDKSAVEDLRTAEKFLKVVSVKVISERVKRARHYQV